ncbi:MAG: thiamine pyrophosphate-binding protein [Candidatus Thermoplasmatota archaeon]|jgi:acetolactate synthase-1/2/3 large subunit|nr:thiamine pyrophosphate-binding protein [Candidatus Thermoplasmatota archaeon]
MKGSDAILELLKEYSVSHVFGLVGETSFPLYESWTKYSEVDHVLARDERNVAIMADGYSRAGNRPGICEVPGVGASYALPGIIEANSSGVPLIILSSDISLSSEKRNFLTEYDKSAMFKSVTKEYISVNNGSDIPRLIRRAFRAATSGRMGPVFVRFPINVYDDVVKDQEIYSQDAFSTYPSLRTSPEDKLIEESIRAIKGSAFPVIIAGQGVLLSHAENELQEFARYVNIPVGTTISGKGAVSEEWELSIGVVGSRGGTDFSNGIVSSADLIIFIGTNVDSASTSEWKNPPLFKGGRKIIQIDISELELGNNYQTDIFLMGDAKLTLSELLNKAKDSGLRKATPSDFSNKRQEALTFVDRLLDRKFKSVNPVKLIKTFEKVVPESSIIAADPGVGAIYSSAYFRIRAPRRKFIFNYSVGGLGFSLPAAIGAFFATNKVTFSLTTDGSFGFFEGELETLSRYKPDVKVILVNNGSFGWIRATMLSHFDKVIPGANFGSTDYSKIAAAHYIPYEVAQKDSEIEEKMKIAVKTPGPFILEIVTEPEDMIVPPVPEWKEAAKKHGREYLG